MTDILLALLFCPPTPTLDCGDLPACFQAQACLDAEGCEHERIIYQQDCSATPRPKYCPPGDERRPLMIVRDRKRCPKQ